MKTTSNRRPPLLHIAGEVFNTPLAILPEKLEVILSSLGSRLVLNEGVVQELISTGALGGRLNVADLAAWDDDDDDSPTSSRSANSDKPYKVTDAGIAIIPIRGTLMEQGGWMSAVSGCSSYEGISKAIRMAMDDDMSVRGVAFKVDSPGGGTHGLFECCNLISSYRGKKPMWSIVKHQCCSAAYALASCADRIVVSMTSCYGSIGCFAMFSEHSKLDADVGYKYTIVRFGDKKAAGNPHEPLHEGALADMKAEVDRQGNLFVDLVAKNRNVARSKVLATEAGLLYADNAIPLLADEMATYDYALAALTAQITGIPIDKSATIDRNGRRADAPAPPVAATAPPPSPDVDEEEDDEENDQGDEQEIEGDKKKMLTQPTAPAATDPNPAAPTPPAVPAQPAAPAAPVPPASASAAVVPAAAPAASTMISAEDMKRIMGLCAIAGHPELAVDYVNANHSPDHVMGLLNKLRAEKSESTSIDANFGVAMNLSTGAMDGLIAAVRALQSTNPSLSKFKATEMAMKNNPSLYAQYEEERAVAMRHPSPKARRAYMSAVAPKLAELGMSTEVGVSLPSPSNAQVA